MQELSAVPDRDIENFCPRTSVNAQTLRAGHSRAHYLPGELPPASEAARLCGQAPRKVFADGGPVDWAFGEALAFGTLVLEGTPVRL